MRDANRVFCYCMEMDVLNNVPASFAGDSDHSKFIPLTFLASGVSAPLCRLPSYRDFPDSARSIRSRPELGILYIPALAVVTSPIKAMHRPSCAHVVSRGGHVVSAIFTADMIWRSTHVKVHSTRAESSRARQAGAGQSATMTAGCPHRCSLLAFVLVT